ncbi:hypothetical protein HAX54_033353 [Datura stramonium]|uniref:Uncharacterized protein n=1 Tax=Datura stramonium TaxID=4076 RepID=A0ABS8VDI7_DATST|nr:hypothetical protein [Datura stramonium]
MKTPIVLLTPNLFKIDDAGYLSPAFGDLPPSLDINMSKLSPIPPTIAKLSKLKFLRISQTNISGPVPEFLTKLKNITYINLSYNNLVGHNQLTGIVPTSFAGWSFDTIDLSRNMLEGDISFLFGKDKTTFEMLLDHNKFEFDFSKLTFGKKLWRLDLNHNKIYEAFQKP